MFNWFRKSSDAPKPPPASPLPAATPTVTPPPAQPSVAPQDPAAAQQQQLADLFVAFARQGQMGQAGKVIQGAVERFPEVGQFRHYQGDVFLNQGRFADAAASYRRAIALQWTRPDVYNNLGIALQAAGDLAAALASFEQAATLDPGYADAHINRGAALADLRRYDEALAAHERAAALSPERAVVHTNRAIALTELRRYDEALRAYAQSLQLDASDAEVHNSEGAVYLLQGRNEKALASFARALQLKPGFARALANQGTALNLLGRRDEALPVFEQLMKVAPGHENAPGLLLGARMHACDWTGRETLAAQVAAALQDGSSAISPFSWLALSDSSELNWRCSRAWQQAKFPPAARPLWQGERYTHDKIRVAYLSADFHNHATAFLMAGMFEQHDTARFETTALSFGPVKTGEMRQRLERAFTRFVEVGNRSDEQIAQLMRELEIDIAVDLKGYTGDARPAIFTHRAAPVQVSYIGYPGTMAAEYIDYIVADAQVIDTADERWYTEKVVYMPGSYQVNDSQRRIADETPSLESQGLPAEGFVFCCFNNNYKITPQVFDIWMRLLQKVPGSVLWLLKDNEAAARNLRTAATQRGVDANRLVFAPRAALDVHLARHRLADLFLDTLPYNAHTTASDALWAGLPVLTLKGKAFAARVASSLLHAVGLPELVTHTPAGYEALALKLATAPAALADLRARLQENRSTALLFDTAAFCRHLESAYETMHARSQAGDAPVSFSVEAPRPPLPGAVVADAADQSDAQNRQGNNALVQDRPQEANHGERCLALFLQGDVEEAGRVIAEGIALHPGNAGYHVFQGNLLMHQKQPLEAAQSYRRALALDAGEPGFHQNLGLALAATGEHEEALHSFDAALALDTANADAHKSRGVALMSLQRHAEALQAYDRALALEANDAGAHFNRAIALTALRRHGDAGAAFARAIELDGTKADVHNSQGLLFSAQALYADALACFDRALQLDPAHADALANRAMTLGHLDRREEQAPAFERLLEAVPDYPYGIGFLLSSRMYACDWTGREALVAQAAEAIGSGKRAVVPFSWLAMQGSAQSQLECSRIYAADKYPPQRQALWKGERYAHQKIRVAYLSADLHNHATAYLMAELFEMHDSERFETTALSFGPDTPSEMRSRLKRAFTQFVDVRGQSDHEIAQSMREMEMDIAVDLKGFTTDSRMGIFTHRAAPVQVSWIGYPGTLGSACMDYIIADSQVASPDVERWYSEKLVYLPDSYQCNDSQRRIAGETPTREQQGLPEKGFVFCCFNNNYKITPEVFDIWMRLLQKVPGSALWLLQDNDLAARNLRAEAAQRGVAPDRLVFAPRAPLDAHLARHRLADLFLDTLPYNAHTTASDALWAGLPVLTCKGEAFASRVAASLLHATGLPELVARSFAEYEAKALELATSPATLAALKERLATNRNSAPLFDAKRMVRRLESAYTTMWERSQRGEPPQTFAVRHDPPAT